MAGDSELTTIKALVWMVLAATVMFGGLLVAPYSPALEGLPGYAVGGGALMVAVISLFEAGKALKARKEVPAA